MNHENTQIQRKRTKVDTMYNSYKVNYISILFISNDRNEIEKRSLMALSHKQFFFAKFGSSDKNMPM